jgi:hypothetical protein
LVSELSEDDHPQAEARPEEEEPPHEEAFAVEKQIKAISGDEPRVSLIGTVISRSPGESSLVVDDGTGQIDVKVAHLPKLASLVRVVAKPFPSEGRVVLDAWVLQDFAGFDVELYRKVMELEARVFRQEGDSHQ